jgi:hypothetical protein
MQGWKLSKGCQIIKTLTVLNANSAVFLDVTLSSLVDKKISSSFFIIQLDRKRFLQNSDSYLR